MRFKTTFAKAAEGNPADNARAAVRAIADGFAGFAPALVMCFAATDYDPDVLAAGVQAAFPDAVTFGCTTTGEACDKAIITGGVAAMAFSGDAFEFSETALVLGDAADAGPGGDDVFTDSDAALNHLAKRLGRPLLDLDYREYLCFMLGDKISPFTEPLVERAGEMMNAFLLGGIAGDDYKFVGLQAVFYKGRAYRNNAAVLSLWKPKNGFALLKTQAVEVTETQLVITRADEDSRIIWEFNGKPATAAYAEAIGVPEESIGIVDFDHNPVGLVSDGEPYLKAIVKRTDSGNGLQFFAHVREGQRFTLTRAGDIRKKTEADLAAKIKEMGAPPAAILHVNCASRYMNLREAGQTESYAEMFPGCPHIAFASYGEIYIGIIAMTSVMILFK